MRTRSKRLRTRRCPLPTAAWTLMFAAMPPLACRSGAPIDPPPTQESYSRVNRSFTPTWYTPDPDSAGDRLAVTAQALGADPAISETLAINQARQAMTMTIDSRVDALQQNLQEQVEIAGELLSLQRFRNVNEIVASEALQGSRVTRKATYADPAGGYRTFVRLELDARRIDAAYLDQLRRFERLARQLQDSETWRELRRRAEQLRPRGEDKSSADESKHPEERK